MANDDMAGRFDAGGDDEAPSGGFLAVREDPAANLLIHEREINQQVATARKYPRDVRAFVGLTKGLVIQDEDTAMECIYALPKRKGSDNEIVGPSIRFAELIGSCWGNSRYASRIIDEGAEFLTAQGLFHDLERNVAISVEVKRRIVSSSGRRYGVDMIGVTSAAAMAIALRNAILKGVPGPMWKPAYAAASSLIQGTFESIEARRRTALKAYAAIGVEQPLVLELLGLNSVEQIEPKHMLILRGTLTALRDGDTTQSQVFGSLPSRVAKRQAGNDRVDLASKVSAGKNATGNGQGGIDGEAASRAGQQGTTQEGTRGGVGNRRGSDATVSRSADDARDDRGSGERAADPQGQNGGEAAGGPAAEGGGSTGEGQGDGIPPRPDDGGEPSAPTGSAGAVSPGPGDGGPVVESGAAVAPAADGIPPGDWKAPERRLFGNIVRDLAKATTAVEVRDVLDSYRESIKVKGEAFQRAAQGLIDAKAETFKAAARSRL